MYVKVVKNFSLVPWKKRSAIAGNSPLKTGNLRQFHQMPGTSDGHRITDRGRSTISRSAYTTGSCDTFGLPGSGISRITTRSSEKKSTKNFYHVWRGHREGLFYKWSESIRGFPGPKFKGFMSWDKAVNFDPSDVDEFFNVRLDTLSL